MALIGGILAVKALPSEPGKRSLKKVYWISGFLFLFVISVILAFVQQVRSTSQQLAAEQKAEQAELKSSGEIKYMQGQLDSINKVLSTVSANSNPQQTIGLLKGLIQPTRELSRPAIERMSNSDLRGRIREFASQMRNWDAASEETDRKLSDDHLVAMRKAGSDEAARAKEWAQYTQSFTQRDVGYKNEYNNQFVATAISYRDELIRRLGPQPVEDFLTRPMALEGTVMHRTVVATANYLEKLANKLPEK